MDDLLTYGMSILFLPLIFYSSYLSQLYHSTQQQNIVQHSIPIISIATALIAILVVIFLTVKAFNKREVLRLGYYGELATAQYLQQLVRGGYHVFHDFPAEKFNIDHIAVGPGGVFAIETKARSKPVLKNGNGRDEAKVIYDGKRLQFPTWNETASLEQAERQAKWLADFLTKSVGEKVNVQPILSLPGWYVERTVRHGMLVVNPKNLSFLLKSKDLSESMINRIAHQLEQKCRDVEPGGK